MYNTCHAHLSSLGIIAPVGLTVKPRFSKYVHPGINLGNIPTDAWRSRIVPPRNLFSSIGIAVAPDMMYAGGTPGFYDQAMGFELGDIPEKIPGWFEMLKKAFYPGQDVETVEPENSNTPEVVAMIQPGFMDKYGKLVLWGGVAAGVYFLMRK